MTPILRCVKPGLAGLLVDNGRYGLQHKGISPSGPMDKRAFFCANALVNNLDKAIQTILELMGDVQFEVLTSACIAVTGPEVQVTVNGQTRPSWGSICLSSGDTLSIAPKNPYQRYYLSVAGGIASPSILNSRTTSLRDNIGGLDGEGSVLKAGDTISTENGAREQIDERCIAPPDYSTDAPIRVICGYQADELGHLVKALFFGQPFEITSKCSRMGYRLHGESLPVGSMTFYSEGVHMGAIQIPPDGQPIVMLADRQTLGGYPKIGAIAQCDLPRFVQATPGTTIRFEPIDVYSARNTWRLEYRRWQQQLASFK